MDWLILIGITAFSIISGYRKGALMMTLRLISFIAGYVVAWKLTPTVAQWFITTHKLQGVIVYPAAGLALFFGVGIILNIVFSILFWLIPSDIKEGGKLPGALLGGFFGLVFSLLCVWTVGIVQNAILQRQQVSAPTNTAQLPTSTLRQLAGKIIASSTQIVLGDNNPSAKLTTQLLSDPVSISKGLNYLTNESSVRELFADANNYRAMVNGTPNDIMQLPSFQKLLTDETAMKFLSSTGLAGKTEQEKQLVLATNFSTYAKNIEKIKHTPEYRAIIADSDIAAKLQARDYPALLTNEKVRLLAEMLVTGSKPSTAATTTAATDKSDNQTSSASAPIPLTQVIYRWTDKNGRTHFTDTPPAATEVSGEVTEVVH